MEIEEMKALWSEMSDQLEQQKKLTSEIIMSMTQERYTNKFRTLSNYERVGAVICFGIAIHIIVNFEKLDTWYLQACGVFTLSVLFILPILVLNSLKKIRNLNITNTNYKETLLNYSKAKRNLLRLQQFGIFLSFILMFAVSGVFAKIWSNKDFFRVERNIWANLSIVFAVFFVVFCSYWGYRSYNRITRSAENILKELE
ncbi:hypothetical protein FEE95_12705 [Maribacter algarum]|uniref:DUF3278 domain-containing protein n=1 Tax=Maribacter algarum (ex Zhang et al. 2020) TaxID=2578118 RepID=A0A5S3PWF2_9FLAO|nr:hypothetical protein [Maribacter algarum]TMM57338.1 hypothetical protein FEE95_12705 [Maribacter algarum]